MVLAQTEPKFQWTPVIYWITKFKKWPMNFAMNAAEKVNVEVLVWISATNNLTAVVKMYELSQYVVQSISRVWAIKFISKKLLKNRFFLNKCQ